MNPSGVTLVQLAHSRALVFRGELRSPLAPTWTVGARSDYQPTGPQHEYSTSFGRIALRSPFRYATFRCSLYKGFHPLSTLVTFAYKCLIQQITFLIQYINKKTRNKKTSTEKTIGTKFQNKLKMGSITNTQNQIPFYVFFLYHLKQNYEERSQNH